MDDDVYLGNVSTEALKAELRRRQRLAGGEICPECEGTKSAPRDVSDGFDRMLCCHPFHEG